MQIYRSLGGREIWKLLGPPGDGNFLNEAFINLQSLVGEGYIFRYSVGANHCHSVSTSVFCSNPFSWESEISAFSFNKDYHFSTTEDGSVS
jgi:hypothetical protein